MIQSVLSHYPLTGLTCVGLLLFFAVFMGALLWVFRKGSSAVYTNLQNLPLQEGNKND
ncbi:MAG TPA: cbb3-type cytochrome c oxidase subunit 3 [Bdellovibrionota bacterium]|jgi:hypothetical protein|nr:cbb3-type cytochrome c oxidase subunit 3 [Bdellovibrionota bacterium]